MPKSTFTVQFDDAYDALLALLAKRSETRKSEIIKRALTLYSFFDEEVRNRKDRQLVVVNKADGSIVHNLLIP